MTISALYQHSYRLIRILAQRPSVQAEAELTVIARRYPSIVAAASNSYEARQSI